MVDAKIIHEDGTTVTVAPAGPPPVWGYGADHYAHIVADPPRTEDSLALCGKPAGWTKTFVMTYAPGEERPACPKCRRNWVKNHPDVPIREA